MAQQLSNLAVSTLAAGIDDNDLAASVAAGHGARFPGTGDYFCTINPDNVTLAEIVKVTARATDALTIVRAQGGTTAKSHAGGATIKQTLTEEGLLAFIQENATYRPGGTDVALADGGTGASLTDPNADRILFWDDSAGAMAFLTAGTGLTITGTTIDASGSTGAFTTDATFPGSPVDGQAHLLRVGASPYHFVPCVYDSTLAKWVSLESDAFVQIAGVTTASTTAANLTGVEIGRASIPHTKECYDAGLRLQAWFVVLLHNSSGANTTFAQVRVREIADGESAATDIWQSTEISVAAASATTKIHDWATITHTTPPADVNGLGFLELWGRVSAGTGTFQFASCKYRWVSV